MTKYGWVSISGAMGNPMPHTEVSELRTHSSTNVAARGSAHPTTTRTELVETEMLRVGIYNKLGT